MEYICWRLTAIFAGRPTIRAATAARMTVGRGVPLDPKPPPTCGEMIRTCSGSSPKTSAIVARAGAAPCVESWIVSRSPSHTAMLACGSIGLLCTAGVR
jgi:hypothetical protein